MTIVIAWWPHIFLLSTDN